MKRKLVVLTEIISPYRIPVFNALARFTEIDLHVIFLAETDTKLRKWHIYTDEMSFSYEVLPSWRWRLADYNILLHRGLAAALREAAPEAILCGGYNYLASWESLRWAKRNDVRFLLWIESTARDLRGGHAVIELLKRKFVSQCDGFVVPGRSSRDYVVSRGVPDWKVLFAPNAVDTQFFSAAATAARMLPTLRHELQLPERYFLFVGRLVPQKGVFDLLDAYAMLDADLRERVGLVFVGDGAARSQLVELSRNIQPGRIQFAGFAQRELLAGYYALAEALVLPTHSDPWGLVVNEGMACCLPILVSDAAGCAADLVTDGWNGRVIKAKDVCELAFALQQLASDAGLRSSMGYRSWEKIQGYSPEDCARGMASAMLAGDLIAHA